MTERSGRLLFTSVVITSVALLALSARASLQQRDNNQQALDHFRGGDDDDQGNDNDRRPNRAISQLPSGQFISPVAMRDAFQQYLNPGLPAYLDFFAGMAVRSQLSPDGTTLAIITAGQNSLVLPSGMTDVSNSTQYIFLYSVEGQNRSAPLLKQVLKQTNSHVGLVFAPDGNTLYAAGGNDDAVYVYVKAGGVF